MHSCHNIRKNINLHDNPIFCQQDLCLGAHSGGISPFCELRFVWQTVFQALQAEQQLPANSLPPLERRGKLSYKASRTDGLAPVPSLRKEEEVKQQQQQRPEPTTTTIRLARTLFKTKIPDLVKKESPSSASDSNGNPSE